MTINPDKVNIVRISRNKELERLPSPDTKRWVVRRKAQVVAAIKNGILSVEEALNRYAISEEELRSWMVLLDNHGVRGLRTTRLQEYQPVHARIGFLENEAVMASHA